MPNLPKKLIILSLNDFPIGVYSTLRKATIAKDVHSAAQPSGGAARYYHMKDVVLDAPAAL